MEFCKTNNLKNSCLTLSKKNKVDSPKTPKLGLRKQAAANLESTSSDATSHLNTPENRKFLNVFGEESPTQNYYDYCSLSQKMLIDDDRDVVWNWDVYTKPSDTNPQTQILKELKFKSKCVPTKKRQEKRAKSSNFCEGLHKLQALQQEKKFNRWEFQNSFDSVLTYSDKEEKHLSESIDCNSHKSKMQNSKVVTDTTSCDSGLSNTINTLNKNQTKEIERLFTFCDEEDTILFKHTQNVEKYNKEKFPIEDSIKLDTNLNQKEKFENFNNASSNSSGVTNCVKNLSLIQKGLDKDMTLKTDKIFTALQHEDSFDELLLSVDLSSEKEKKSQFQRHNSMPSNSINKPILKCLARYGSSNEFSIEMVKQQKVLISPISDVTDASVESSEDVDVNKEINQKTKRCSKEEIEAKRFEAKRKRLLKTNKIYLK